ncbi:hypothetical protein PFISCL1PPCAC_2971, partial [Pristionchus fissidentatus]
FNCSKCGVFLAAGEKIKSNAFQGPSGSALLFSEVENIVKQEARIVEMITGRHMIRFVACSGCYTKYGTAYELAFADDQRYKEGWTVLENAYLKREDFNFSSEGPTTEPVSS